MTGKIILSGILFLTFSLKLSAQQKSIEGTITSKEDGSPISGIIVMVKGSHQGLVTADDGHFDLIVSEGDTIELSSRYFVSRDVVVGSDFRYTIDLDEKNSEKRTGYLNIRSEILKNTGEEISFGSSKKYKNRPVKMRE